MQINRPRIASKGVDDPLWLQYELSVHEMLSALDPSARVLHNRKIDGRLSGTLRQVDVWAIGTVMGLKISVAVECKRHTRPVNVELIDQFVGKLLDLHADRGIVYSHSGFTASAVRRAVAASTPFVLTVDLAPSASSEGALVQDAVDAEAPGAEEVTPPWVEDLSAEDFAAWLKTGRWSESWS